MHSFVAGRPILRKGYNMVAFLEDFLKYYNKGPNFARDALATGLVDLATGNNVAATQVRLQSLYKWSRLLFRYFSFYVSHSFTYSSIKFLWLEYD